MATPIDQIGQHELNPTLRALAHVGVTVEDAAWLRSGKDGERAARFKRWIASQRALEEKNLYKVAPVILLAALQRANDEEGWGITKGQFACLAANPPPWPKGRDVYLSFKIRFGEGDEGVALTFERHVARIKSVFGEKEFWRWGLLRSGKVDYQGKPVERLRLLVGNHTHKPIVEWIVVDTSTHRTRESVSAVRGPESLADELLVLAWLYPHMIKAIDDDKLPGLIAGGYEVNVPECGGGPWRHVVIVDFGGDDRRVGVSASGRSSASSDFSVPSAWK